MVYFKEPYYFPRFQWGSIVFQGVELFTGVGQYVNFYRNL